MQLFEKSESDAEEESQINPDERITNQITDDPMKPHSSNSSGFAPVLRNSRFLILWSGQIFSQLADKVYLVLMIAIIANTFPELKDRASIINPNSAIMIAFTIPAVLFGSLAGVYVNRWSKKGVLVISNLLRGIFVLIIPSLLWLARDFGGGWLNWPAGFFILLGITFLVSTLTQFFAPAEQAIIPLIVKRQHLLPANSLYATTMMASLIVGFAVGEPLLVWADSLLKPLSLDFGKELLVGGSYIVAGLLLILVKAKETKKDLQTTQNHVFRDIWDGVLYLNENRRVRNALIQLIILFSVFATLPVLAVALAERIPDMKPEQFGRLIAAGGVGIGCVAAIIGNLGQRFSHAFLSVTGLLGVSASLVGLSLSTGEQWLALLMTAFLGGFAALVIVPMQTTVQAETPADMRGKVFGLQNNLVNIAISLPLALAGTAEHHFGLRPTLVGLAGIVLLAGIFVWNLSSDRAVKSTKVDKSGR
ncbi:MAG: MFS transporter [Prochloraceae cyanobacterium]|nr:MFS transporter [Prochloraceae cyanobacterium]